MNELIKLLVSNIYVVIVLVGFLLTLVNKMRTNKPGNPAPNRMPTFGGEPPLRRPGAPPIDARPVQPQRQAVQQRPVERTPEPQQGVYKSKFNAPGEEGVSSEYADTDLLRTVQPVRGNDRAPLPKAAHIEQTKQADAFRVPQGDELRRAFILAEVLGEPRSKRPLCR
ncbi:hypothetical protein [Paenibacillus sp. CF384]|uniref:hypothetical protein n=1 Tax=Paenibacillus sp. CF384 TaxID=1884382 RepID=UPI00089CA53B|nr:hypothetical protein [Paenibacillus sp. CF384]SDW88381.1 hypothetical protein SAMN05518855_1006147 [Paenibacillus sp. CF384]